MSDSTNTPLRDLGLRIEEVCARFEAEWQAGRRPRLTAYLGSATAPEYSYLLPELVHLDVHYRRQAGENPAPEDYRNTWPECAAWWNSEPAMQPAEPPPPALLGNYELMEEIGRGGMGVVYKARQRQLNRLAAVKMILHGDYADARAQSRLRAEAEAIARLQHPNIVQIFEIGDHDGKPFIALEFCAGGCLRRQLDGTPQPARQAAQRLRTLARAMQAAHAKQVLHRDLKPANVLITEDGTLKITDFGLAKKLDGTEDTASGTIIQGTPSYMAPEQASGNNKSLGPTCDIYALGAILYELLTGRPPFKAATMLETLSQVAHDEPVPPTRLQPRTPRDLETICLKCLSKEPQKRYATAQALADDLDRWLEGRPIHARPVGTVERTYRWCRQNPVVAGLVGGIVLLLVGITIASLLAVERLRETELAGRYKLWEAYLEKANALRTSGRKGQRFESLRAIKEALKLPVPPGKSLDQLRDAAIAALCLPDIGKGPEWDPAIGLAQPEERAFRVSLEQTRQWKRLPEPKFQTRGPQFSADGRFVLVALKNYMADTNPDKHMTVPVRLWRMDGIEPEYIFDDPGIHEASSAFRPDSRQLALGHSNGSLSVYDTESGDEILSLSVKNYLSTKDYGAPVCLAFHPSLPRLAVGAGNAVLLFDVGSGKFLRPLMHPDNVSSLAWRPDGQQLAAGCGDSRIYLWDAETGRQVTAPWSGHKGNGGIRLSFNQAGDRVVSNDWSSNLRLWDALTGREIFSTPQENYFYADSTSPGMLGPRTMAGKLTLLRVAEGRELRQLLHGMYHHPDNRLHAFGSDDGLTFLDLASGNSVAVVPLMKQAVGVQGFDESGGMWTMNPERVFWHWPIRPPTSDQHAYQIGPPERVFDCPAEVWPCWSKDGQVVAIPQRSKGTLVLFRGEGSKTVLLKPQFDVRSCAVSPDGRWVATASWWPDASGTMIKIWEASSGCPVMELPAAKARFITGFSPDGRWLATALGRVDIEGADLSETFHRLWRVGTWEEGGTIPTLGSPCLDQDLVLEIQNEGSITITQISTGRQLARLASPDKGRLIAPQLQHQSGYVIAWGVESRTLYVWDLPLIRRQLAEMGLDWEGPPVFSAAQMKLARSPYTVHVDAGELAK